jgi:DNA-binding transcriptional LysR family regulator
VARNLVNLDLNLLVSLDVLLRERSVTRAAGRLGLSQPALSASLARLRRHFGDELLVRVGNSYELTPLAAQLAERTAAALAVVERVFASAPVFDPSASDRSFRVLVSDYSLAVLGEPLTRLLVERAPSVRLELEHHTPALVDSAADALRDADGIILPRGFLSDLPKVDLFTDTWSCLVWTGNPAVGETLTMADLAEMPWVVNYHSRSAFTPSVRQLENLGVEPRVQVVVESFLAVPYFVTGTDRVALVQSRLARQLQRGHDVRVLPCPFDVVPLVEALWWHPVHRRDPAHAWLRQLFAEAAASLDPVRG